MLDRLLNALETKGLTGRGSFAKIAKDTGYSPASVSVALNGKEPITEKFLRAICITYGFNGEWIKTGNGEMLMNRNERNELLANVIYPKIMEMIEESKLDGQNSVTTVPPPNGKMPVVGMGSGGADGPMWEDAYPVGYGMEMINRPHDVSDPKAFAIKIDGDSMSPRYDNGEIVVVAPGKEVKSGDFVGARIADGRVVVKRIRFTDGIVLLESVNPQYPPIIIQREELVFAYKIVWKKEGA